MGKRRRSLLGDSKRKTTEPHGSVDPAPAPSLPSQPTPVVSQITTPTLPPIATRDELEAGDSIGQWVVEALQGHQQLGSVYRCHNRHAQRITASIKVSHVFVSHDDIAKKRFIREAELLFMLNHPGIIRARNVDMTVSRPYLELENIEGQTLQATLAQRQTLFLGEALELTEQLLDSLVYLQRKRIAHRRLRPSTVMVRRDGTIKLTDFGHAFEAQGPRLTIVRREEDDLSYLPPEWLDDEQDGHNLDVYAAALMLFEMLTGGSAHPSSDGIIGTAREVAYHRDKVARGPLDPGPKYRPDLRETLQAATHPDPAQRITDARALLRRLQRLEREYL